MYKISESVIHSLRKVSKSIIRREVADGVPDPHAVPRPAEVGGDPGPDHRRCAPAPPEGVRAGHRLLLVGEEKCLLARESPL